MPSSYKWAEPPLVSVLIPAYNAERWIARTLQSVLGQTYQQLDVWVVDDGSTDRTATIVSQMAQIDPRLHLLQQPNAGVAAARNRAAQAAAGVFLAPIDADDLWHPQHLADLVACLTHAPDSVGLAYAWSLDIDESDQPTGGFHAAMISGSVHTTLLCHNFLGNASCTLIRRSVFLQVGGYDEQFQAQQMYGCEDWDLDLRIAAISEFRVVPQFSVGYRKLPNSMSYHYERMADSHNLMLQKVRHKYALPSFLYGLSRSSLYLYFAQQSSTQQSSTQQSSTQQSSTCQGDRATLHWLKAAVQANWSPLLRLGTYRLALSSWLNLRFNLRQNLRFNLRQNLRFNLRENLRLDLQQNLPPHLQPNLQQHLRQSRSRPSAIAVQAESVQTKAYEARSGQAEFVLAEPRQVKPDPNKFDPNKFDPNKLDLAETSSLPFLALQMPSKLQVTFKLLVGNSLHGCLSWLEHRLHSGLNPDRHPNRHPDLNQDLNPGHERW
ncbi:MAG: glycosyltransferase family 2 protein [Elainella sp. Prado103]|nr:glycosyltransferase family 2 protein [Elainella sp. Prado103]